ncbi:MAG: PKD domain-containing protein [Bacteroidota bacterium]|nr:PKD domain-containing protein [Bacteroidota bacterium]
MKGEMEKGGRLLVTAIFFLFFMQVQPSLAETYITPEQFMDQIEGKIDFYSYPRIGVINGWARDTNKIQYYDKDGKWVISLTLTDDHFAKDVEFRRYSGDQVGTIPDSFATVASKKVIYFPPPTVTTNDATAVTDVSATLKMDYDFKDYGSGWVHFIYREDGASTWSEIDTVSKSGSESYEKEIKGLSSGTVYYFKAQLCYDSTVISGTEKCFKTPALPTVTTKTAKAVMDTSATLVMDYDFKDYGPGNVRFKYRRAGHDLSYTSWVSKSGSGSCEEGITGLSVGTTYYFTAQLRYDSTVIEGTETAFTTSKCPPVCLFKCTTNTPNVGELVEFDASASYDPDGEIVSYKWDFGDGDDAEGMVARHSYSKRKTYTVKLTVIDDVGAESSTEKIIVIYIIHPPIGAFRYAPGKPMVLESVEFNASASYDPDGEIVSYKWDFGDGEDAEGMVARHSYSKRNTYTVKLTVTDDEGAKNSTCLILYIPPTEPPVCSFNFTPNSPTVIESVEFDACASYDPDGGIEAYVWDFGDGKTAEGKVVYHSYSAKNTYTVNLTVTDNEETKSSTCTSIYVCENTHFNKHPVCSFKYTPTSPKVSESVEFDASASNDLDGYIKDYMWDFGDGGTAKGKVVYHSYSTGGIYTIELTVTDDKGAECLTRSSLSVPPSPPPTSPPPTRTNLPPVCSFRCSTKSPEVKELVEFDASDSCDHDGKIKVYLWDFGDGKIANEGIVVSHSYSTGGACTVKLIVMDDGGAENSTETIIVINRPPKGSCEFNPRMPETNELIAFDATSSEDPDVDGYIEEYMWDFGDGKTGRGKIVNHNYSQADKYDVKLTVTDNKGAEDLFNLTVSVEPPRINWEKIGVFVAIILFLSPFIIIGLMKWNKRRNSGGNNAKEPEGGAEGENSEDNKQA